MEASIKRKKVGTNLTEGPILKNLIVFAIPLIMTNIIQQLYSIIDLALMGKLVGSAAAVAVNNGSEISDLLLPIAQGFSAGGQVLIAQLSGAKDEEGIKKIENKTGQLVDYFAYPYGTPNEIGEREYDLVSSLNLKYAFMAHQGCITEMNKNNLTHLPRVYLKE